MAIIAVPGAIAGSIMPGSGSITPDDGSISPGDGAPEPGNGSIVAISTGARRSHGPPAAGNGLSSRGMLQWVRRRSFVPGENRLAWSRGTVRLFRAALRSFPAALRIFRAALRFFRAALQSGAEGSAFSRRTVRSSPEALTSVGMVAGDDGVMVRGDAGTVGPVRVAVRAARWQPRRSEQGCRHSWNGSGDPGGGPFRSRRTV
jgi:hypothetical protein